MIREWVPALGPALVLDLQGVWVLERAEESALDEASVQELSAPARAWLLLWNWLLESLTPPVDPLETDRAASPAVTLQQEILSAGWLPG